MAGRGRNRSNRNRQNQCLTDVARDTALSLPGDSPVLALFKNTAIRLNNRYDRHERLVKLSRDLTIESKRIIFLLHSAISKDDTKKALEEAGTRLNNLTNGPIKAIGIELENSPAYLHLRAVSPGLQEFVEAKTLYGLIKNKQLVPCSEIKKEFEYMVKTKQGDEEIENKVTTLLPQVEYMLGLADLTGELMRRAINSIANGDSEECFYSCQVVRDLYTGFLGLFGCGKEIARKMSTTRNNVYKVETAVYALHVRGGEASPSLLLPIQGPPHHEIDTRIDSDDDEGYY